MLHLLLIITGALPVRRRDDRGATTAEYGLIAALCVLAFVAGIEAVRIALGGIIGATQNSMDNSVP